MNRLDRSTSWVVAFGGAGREGVIRELLMNDIRVEAVIVPRQSNAKLDAAIEQLRSYQVRIVDASRAEIDEVFGWFRESALLSVGFPYIIPLAVLERHPVALNLHPTLLPKYRGPTSAAYILINDEAQSGSTAHLMAPGVDEGRIIAQRSFDLTPFDTVRSVQRKSYALERGLVMDAIEALLSGYEGAEQDATQASSYPRTRSPDDSRIDPQLPLLELINAIRACDPVDFPAFFDHHGERLCIKLWRPGKVSEDEDCL